MTRWLGSRSTCSFSGLGRNGESLPLWDKIIAPWGLFCAVHEAFRIAHFQNVQDYVSQFITTIVEANTKPGYTFLVELEVPEHRGSQWSNSGFIWPQNGLSKRQTPSCSVWSCSPSSITQLAGNRIAIAPSTNQYTARGVFQEVMERGSACVAEISRARVIYSDVVPVTTPLNVYLVNKTDRKHKELHNAVHADAKRNEDIQLSCLFCTTEWDRRSRDNANVPTRWCVPRVRSSLAHGWRGDMSTAWL
jgi:hypothetical protein